MAKYSQRVTIGHRAAVCGLIIAGLTMTEACRIAGVPREQLPKYLPANWHGRKCRRARRWKGDELESLHQDYIDAAQKTSTIAARYGVSISRITKLAQQHGWAARRSGNQPKAKSIRTMSPKQRTIYFKLRQIMPPAEAAAQACQ